MVPRWPQDGPKRAQDGPKRVQDGAKMAPGLAPRGPKGWEGADRRLEPGLDSSRIRIGNPTPTPIGSDSGPTEADHGPPRRPDSPKWIPKWPPEWTPKRSNNFFKNGYKNEPPKEPSRAAPRRFGRHNRSLAAARTAFSKNFHRHKAAQNAHFGPPGRPPKGSLSEFKSGSKTG